LSRRLKRYYGRLRHPPGTLPTSRLSAGYRTRSSGRTRSIGPPGRGGSPQFPPPPSERSEPHTPGGSSGLQSRIFTPSTAFAVTTAARLLLFPPAGGVLTTRQASLDASDRSVAPPNRAFDAALRPRAFPPEASSLLPGLPTATRTGPSPVSDDELTLDQLINKHLQLLGTHWNGRGSSAPAEDGQTTASPGAPHRVASLRSCDWSSSGAQASKPTTHTLAMPGEQECRRESCVTPWRMTTCVSAAVTPRL
jgi:hypothetical protein